MARGGSNELYKMTAVELRRRIGRRELSPVELLDYVYDRIDALDPKLHAFVYQDRKAAKAQAREAEKAAKAKGGELPPLHGIPVSIKDLVMVKGMPFTRGSRLFAKAVPPENAPIVDRLVAAGAIITGKTNTSEIGWKGATSNRLFPETLNPWDLTRTPGGSSGGAAAAAAAGMGPIHIGTDGGGSIRMPASYVGIYGFKASHGRLPLYPAAPVGTISHVGPMTRTVADAAAMYRVMAGPDERDLYSLPPEPDQPLDPLEGLRIGWAPTLGKVKVDPEVRRICEKAVKRFADARCEIVPLDLQIDDPMDVLVTHFRLGMGAAVRGFPNWQDEIDPGLRKFVEPGEGMSAFSFGQAISARGRLWDQLRKYFEQVDVLVTPTTPTTAFKAGQNCPDAWLDQDEGEVRWFAITALCNLTGQPAASVPCGYDSKGLPVGLHLIGRRHADWTVLRLSKTFEELAPWQADWPAIAAKA